MPISFNFSPLAALVLGILIGFLIEWFLELLYFRRQRRGSEERLARAEADLQARSRDLLAIRTQADALRSDLSTAKARVTSLQGELQACQAATADAHGQAASLQTQLHDTTTQVSGLQSGRQDVDARLGAALGELEMLRAQVGEANSRRDSLDAALQAREAAYKSLDTALAESRTHEAALQDELARLRTDFQTRDATLGAALGDLERLRAQVGEANSRRDSLDAALQAREAAYKSLDTALAESRTHESALQDELARLRTDFQTRDATLGAAQGDLDSLRQQLKETTARRDSLDSALLARDAAYRALESALAESRTHEASLQDQLADLRADVHARDTALAESDSLRGQLAGAAPHLELAAAEERTVNLPADLPAGDRRGAPFGQEASDLGQPSAGLVGGAGAGFESAKKALDAAANLGTGESPAFKSEAAEGITGDLSGAETPGVEFGHATPAGGLAGLGAGLAAGGIAFGASGQKPGVTACPQDLSKVHGVGQSYEGKLYAAGIGSFWELAHADDEELRRIFGIKGFQKVDLAAIKADALRLAEATNSVGRGWDGSQPDDFETMEGIGPVFEGQLYDAGICTNRALADATEKQLAQICPTPAWRRPNYADWIRQAKARLGEV